MSTEKTEPTFTLDGGAPTAQEALLASQLEGLGDNPTEEPVVPAAAPAATPAAAPAATPAAAPAAEGAVAAPASAAPAAAEVDDAVAAPAAAAPAAAPAAPPPVVAAKPEPPKDFETEFTKLQQLYDDGEIDGAKFQADQRALVREEGAYTARVTLWEERQNAAVLAATNDFSTTALAWEKEHADFMSNPLRAQQMQSAIQLIDAQTKGSLPAAELFDRAAKATFEAFGYMPPKPAAQTVVDAKTKVAEAVAARQPTPVPQTLANASEAAPIEPGARNATFENLDGMNISDLEDALARMTPAQVEAYTRNAPGANSTLRGTEKD